LFARPVCFSGDFGGLVFGFLGGGFCILFFCFQGLFFRPFFFLVFYRYGFATLIFFAPLFSCCLCSFFYSKGLVFSFWSVGFWSVFFWTVKAVFGALWTSKKHGKRSADNPKTNRTREATRKSKTVSYSTITNKK